jgi:hypothetical protein
VIVDGAVERAVDVDLESIEVKDDEVRIVQRRARRGRLCRVDVRHHVGVDRSRQLLRAVVVLQAALSP